MKLNMKRLLTTIFLNTIWNVVSIVVLGFVWMFGVPMKLTLRNRKTVVVYKWFTKIKEYPIN